jgi:hypothetical protein
MVKNGDSVTDFKFYSYTNDMLNVVPRECVGTAGFNYVDLIGSYLFLVDNSTSTPVYHVCTYVHTATTTTPVTLNTASLVTGSISQFDPYLNDGADLYVLVGNGLLSQVVRFNAADGTATKVGNFY